VSKIYIRGALGCVIISDILNEKSLESALKWKELIDENCDYVDGSPIPCFLGIIKKFFIFYLLSLTILKLNFDVI
jgi:hypothetical protein